MPDGGPRAIVPIVEGPGELEAVPWLLRQLLWEKGEFALQVKRALNAHGRGNLTVEGGLERFLQYAASVPGCCGVLILVDANGDCPLDLAHTLATRAEARSLPVPVAIVVAYREYETWFLASLGSIRGQFGLGEGLQCPRAPDRIGDPKGWLARHMRGGRVYKETTDQFPMTRAMDQYQAVTNRSFRRLAGAVDFLAAASSHDEGAVSPDPAALQARLHP